MRTKSESSVMAKTYDRQQAFRESQADVTYPGSPFQMFPTLEACFSRTLVTASSSGPRMKEH